MRTVKALINGEWHHALEETPQVRGTLAGHDGGFRGLISAERGAEFPAQPGRYHLYVSYACPWAHRTLIYRRLKQLEDVISISVLHPRWAGPEGWRFGVGHLSTVDHVAGRSFLHEVYRTAHPGFTGRVTVPVLWDRERATIVNNESGDIIRMLNSEFDAWGDDSVDFYPEDLRREIDAMNAWILPRVCQGVYRAGFASNQVAYERAVLSLFECLDDLEARLRRQPYLLGKRITESDWHLFATLCRFDSAYYGALKCNLHRLTDYPALSAYARRLYKVPGVAETVRTDQIKQHYFDAIGEIEPTIVPLGPVQDFRSVKHACGATQSEASHAPTAESNIGDFLSEVRELHRFLERWLKGEVSNDDNGLAPFRDALAEDFIVVHPDGSSEGKSDVIRNFAVAHGEKPAGYKLKISDLSLRMISERLCLAIYREDHGGEPGRARISSALLSKAGDEKIEWLFLQETPLA